MISQLISQLLYAGTQIVLLSAKTNPSLGDCRNGIDTREKAHWGCYPRLFGRGSNSTTHITRRAQGCKQAGCRRRQERHSAPSTLKTKQVYSYHENPYMNTMILCERNRTVSPYNRSLLESVTLRRPLRYSVPWHFLTLTSALDAQAGHPPKFRAT